MTSSLVCVTADNETKEPVLFGKRGTTQCDLKHTLGNEFKARKSTEVLTLIPKSTDVELQMAPMLAAANMASTA